MVLLPRFSRRKADDLLPPSETSSLGAAELKGSNRLEVAYSISMVLAGVLGFAKVFVYARILDSTWFGLYGLGMLLSGFGITICHLGVYRGLDCLLPTLYGAQKHAEARHLRNAAAGLVLALSVMLIVVAMVCGFFARTISVPTRFVVVAAAWLAVSNALLGLGIQDQRSRGRTLSFGIVLLAKSVLNLLFGVLLAQWLGCTGILVAEAAVAMVLFLVVIRLDCLEFRFAIPTVAVLALPLRTGMPLLFKNLLNDLALSLDRWCIPAAVGLAAFGQYTFGLLPVSTAMLVHNMIWSSVGPRTAQDYGRHGDVRRVLKTLHGWTSALGVLAIVGWLPVQLASRYIIPDLFPKYVAGAHLLTILYWGAVFQVVSLYDWVPMVLQRTKGLMYVTVASLAATGLLLLVSVSLNWPLQAYAWIFVVGRGVAAVGQFLLALHMANTIEANSAIRREEEQTIAPTMAA